MTLGLIATPFAGPLNLFEIFVNNSLDTNLKCCLDVGAAASYTSGQKWLDLAGSGYDFFRGVDVSASTDDPTFNGSAGGLSSAEYWSFDGGDYFQYDTSNETFMENLHKNGANFTIMALHYSATNNTLFSFMGALPGLSNDDGIAFLTNNSGNSKPRFKVANGTGAALDVSADTGGSTGWHFTAVTIDEATGAGGGFFYQDGAYLQVSSSNTFDCTYSSPSAAVTDYTYCIGSTGNGSNLAPNGDRLIAWAVVEGGNMTKANLDTIYAAVGPRVGI